jgi:hypothetical protein
MMIYICTYVTLYAEVYQQKLHIEINLTFLFAVACATGLDILGT